MTRVWLLTMALWLGSVVSSWPIYSQQQAVVSAALDSVTVEMGDRTVLHVSLIVPPSGSSTDGHLVGLPGQGQEVDGVEYLEAVPSDTTLADGRMRRDIAVLIQAFEPGIVTLPRVGYAVGTDTTWSEVLTLDVREVPLDSLETINPVAGTVTIKGRWYDWVPDWVADWWMWIVLGILLVAMGITIWILYQRNGARLLPRRRVVPPYEQATMELEKLRAAKLVERGHIKEYYTRLVDILRTYLAGRYGIPAMEMTSSQVLAAIADHPQAREARSDIRELLSTADFVKFAKVLPEAGENQRSFNAVRDFVEETRPEPEPDTKPEERSVAEEDEDAITIEDEEK